MMQMSLEWATQRLINLHNAWREQMVDVLARLGMQSIRELRGRTRPALLPQRRAGSGG